MTLSRFLLLSASIRAVGSPAAPGACCHCVLLCEAPCPSVRSTESTSLRVTSGRSMSLLLRCITLDQSVSLRLPHAAPCCSTSPRELHVSPDTHFHFTSLHMIRTTWCYPLFSTALRIFVVTQCHSTLRCASPCHSFSSGRSLPPHTPPFLSVPLHAIQCLFMPSTPLRATVPPRAALYRSVPLRTATHRSVRSTSLHDDPHHSAPLHRTP